MLKFSSARSDKSSLSLLFFIHSLARGTRSETTGENAVSLVILSFLLLPSSTHFTVHYVHYAHLFASDITPNTITTIRNAHLFTPQIRSNLAQNPFQFPSNALIKYFGHRLKTMAKLTTLISATNNSRPRGKREYWPVTFVCDRPIIPLFSSRE